MRGVTTAYGTGAERSLNAWSGRVPPAIADPGDGGYSGKRMHRLTRLSALLLAIALAVQTTAQTVCEAVCLGVTQSGSSASTVQAKASPECHSIQTNHTPSATLVPRDSECLHADAARSFRAERVLIGAARWASVSLPSIAFAVQRNPPSASVTDWSHAPPGTTVAAIASLRL